MEFIRPDLITDGRTSASGAKRLLPYTELKTLPPVVVNNSLNLLPGDENSALFEDYCREKLKLIHIKRSNPDFKHRPDFPSRVLLEMTSRCNLNCTMCPRQNLQRERVDIEEWLFKKCVDELDNYGIDGLWLYNIGESILHPDFPELLDYASSMNNLGPLWHSSNGQELDEHYSRMIINSKIVFMNMSVNAVTPETYNRISPGADWHKMVSNFERFINLKRELNRRTPFARIQIIDQEYARGEIDGFLKKYSDIADILSVNALEAFSRNIEGNVEYAAKRERPERKTCRRVNRQDLFILSNGETTFCDTDYNGTFSMGNLKEKSIYDIWNSDFRKNIIELNKTGMLNEINLCKNCLDFDL